jgi:hypothetical protein
MDIEAVLYFYFGMGLYWTIVLMFIYNSRFPDSKGHKIVALFALLFWPFMFDFAFDKNNEINL